MKKSLPFILAAATLGLVACNNGGKDRAEIPTTEQGVVDKVADGAVLVDAGGVTFSAATPNEVKYGDILYPAITWRVKAKMDAAEGKDKDGVGYVTANLAWTFDANWKINTEGPDAAHYKATETSETKDALKAEGAQEISSTASVVITFGAASKTIQFSLKLLPKA